jgi:hypothetical protein
MDCGDGIYVGRDASDSCQFSDCPPLCTADVNLCPDGSIVGRDRLNDCEFPPCPTDP